MQHAVSAPEARRIVPETSADPRADCARAGGASERLRKDFWSSHRLSPHSLRCCNKVWEVASATQRHTVTAPQAQRTISEWSPFSRADCERARGAARPFRKDFWSPAQTVPTQTMRARHLWTGGLFRCLPRRAPGGTCASDFPPGILPRRAPGGTKHSLARVSAQAASKQND